MLENWKKQLLRYWDVGTWWQKCLAGLGLLGVLVLIVLFFWVPSAQPDPVHEVIKDQSIAKAEEGRQEAEKLDEQVEEATDALEESLAVDEVAEGHVEEEGTIHRKALGDTSDIEKAMDFDELADVWDSLPGSDQEDET